MKQYIWGLLLFLFLFISCDRKSKVEKAVEAIPMQMKADRFDKAFFEAGPAGLLNLKAEYPFFFPPGNGDQVWIDKMQNPQWRELYAEVEKKYGNFEPETNKIEELFRHIKYYFPQTKTPKLYTVISEMDYQNKVIYSNNALIISLELYLGKNHRFYEFPAYLKQNFEENQILPDIVSAFAVTKTHRPQTILFLPR